MEIGRLSIESTDKTVFRLTNMSKLIQQNEKDNTTKIMRISNNTFNLLKEFSRKYHPQPSSYDDLIEELYGFWKEKHDELEKKYYFHLTRI